MEKVKIKIVNLSGNEIPKYETPMSAGMDLRASLKEDLLLKPGFRTLVPTGIRIQLPEGYEAQIRPRSGLAIKKGVTVLNAPGTVDADYRGDVGVILINHGFEDFIIKNGDRIAQMVIARHERAEWIEVSSLDETERGEGGFGHSGIK